MLACHFLKMAGRYVMLYKRQTMLWLREKVPSYLQVFFYKENKHLLFFSSFFLFFLLLVISHCRPRPLSLSLPPFMPLLIFNISLFHSSRSTLSANSCLSAAQKWLCLADSTDKWLNACCPQRRWRRGKEGGGRLANRGRWGNWE